MGFYKNTIMSIDKNDVEVIDGELIKTAAFKLPDGIMYDPDFLYIRVKAVSAGESWGDNKNSDYFPRHELIGSHKTFLTAHVFKNHENKDIKNAIGDVLEAEWDELMDCVKLLIRIDSKIAPSIVRGFQKGYMTDVSMGCRVDHSICSICGNKAKTPKEYCEHVRFERGKLYDDGRKVYEINIGPKFHDISAVLNGAEKTAKVTSIYIPSSKAASTNKTGLEKAASFNSIPSHDDAFMQKVAMIEVSMLDLKHNNTEKKASIDLIGNDLFPDNLMSKRAYAHKIAELRKEIDATIESISDKEVTDDLVENADSSRNLLRMIAENYWDGEKCIDVANILKEMADEKDMSLQEVFCQFLNVVNFTGCELAPKEFTMIADHLFELGESEYDEEYSDKKEDEFAQSMKAPSLAGHSIETLINSALKAIHGNIYDAPEGFSPAVRGITIIAAMPNRKPAFSNNIENDIINRFTPLFKERSVFSPKMVKKASNQNDNTQYWMMPNSLVKQAMYMLYQHDRTERFGNAAYIRKSANFMTENFLMEKTAGSGYTRAKAFTLGLPVVFGYSAYQRSRMKNGENINSINRFIADNPASAYLIQGLFAPPIYKGSAKAVKNVGDGARKLYWSAANATGKVKMADIVYGNMEKTAGNSILQVEKLRSYDTDQEKILKTAGIMSKAGYDDAAHTILSNVNLDDSDLENYLHIQKNAAIINITDTLRKDAQVIADLEKINPIVDFDRVVMQVFTDIL